MNTEIQQYRRVPAKQSSEETKAFCSCGNELTKISTKTISNVDYPVFKPCMCNK